MVFSLGSSVSKAQEKKEDLGDKEYIIVKDYKPVLGESVKISDSPADDTTSSNPPTLTYDVRPKKASTEYETATIKAVKIMDEKLAKLYRTYIKLGIGNYTTYYGDLYVNALRSKKGTVGLALNHHSGSPGLKEAGPAGFSNNHGGLYGKYFFERSTFTGDVNYNRDAVHYYATRSDTILKKENIKQRLNNFDIKLGMASNNLTKDHLDYAAKFNFNSLNDLYDVNENDFLVGAKVGKKIDDYNVSLDASFDYFKKSLANGELISLNNNLKRSIVSFTPAATFKKDKVDLTLGLTVSVDKHVKSKLRMFPKIDLSLPIAENILYAFAGANGGVIKNTYRTMSLENPFVAPAADPTNSIEKLQLKAGLNGNFSQRVSFMAMVKYSTIDKMQLFIADSVHYNQFNVLYVDGKVLNLHAEVGYRAGEKFSAALRFDQYSYDMELGEKPWQHPGSEMSLTGKYNVWDKLIINAAVYARGKYDVRIDTPLGFTSTKVNGYMDLNLGLEYRYSKILSLFVNLNNLGFAKYERWYHYPSERLNALGGISYAF